MPASWDAAIEELQGRLERFSVDRYPVQHATAQFHLGTVLLQQDRPDEAARALRRATALFRPDQLPVEHAKAANMLGVALRACGDHGAAATAFGRAVELFEANDQPLEQAAARFNLGLAHREAGRDGEAVDSLRAAADTFEHADVPGQAGAAARELGVALLHMGDLDAAHDRLLRALELADRAGDLAGRGAAFNGLGLVHLAAGRLDQAHRAFSDAVAGHPRSVRPEPHAMAALNLALTAEARDDGVRAGLIARQAMTVPGAPAPVVDQARALLERVGDDADALHLVLDGTPPERWPDILRPELVRWADATEVECRRSAGAWVDGIVRRSDQAEARAEAWMGILLELPPDTMDRLVRVTLQVVGERDPDTREQFVDATDRVMVRFGMPQFIRTKDLFNRVAADLGLGEAWG